MKGWSRRQRRSQWPSHQASRVPASLRARAANQDLGNIKIVEVLSRECSAFLLSLKNEWFACKVRYSPFGDGTLMISDATKGIVGGMSGSPILSEYGAAIGVVCLGTVGSVHLLTGGGPNPRLMDSLPGWFLKALQSLH